MNEKEKEIAIKLKEYLELHLVEFDSDRDYIDDNYHKVEEAVIELIVNNYIKPEGD